MQSVSRRLHAGRRHGGGNPRAGCEIGKALQGHRLLQKVRRAESQARLTIGIVRESREGDDRSLRRQDTRRGHDLKSTISATTEANIRDDEVERPRSKQRLGTFQGRGRKNGSAIDVKKLYQYVTYADLVLDNEDARLRGCSHASLLGE